MLNNKLKEAKEKDDSNEKEKECSQEHCNSNSLLEEKSKCARQPYVSIYLSSH